MFITFAYPYYLVFVVLIPLLFFINLYTLKRERKNALRFANFEAIARIRGVSVGSKNITVISITIVIIVLIVLSLAGTNLVYNAYSSEHSFVIAIDSSRSMEANDLYPSRFESAKDVARTFVDNIGENVRIGIVSFSGNSLIKSEITEDKVILKQTISNLEISPLGGTDIFEAVTSSTNLLRNEESKAIILLSDGQINIGTIGEAIAYASEERAIVHTIALGTPEGGTTTFGVSKLDEDTLKSLSYSTGGKYFRVTTRDELTNAFNEIFQLKIKRVYRNISRELLVLAALLFVLQYYLISTRYRVYP